MRNRTRISSLDAFGLRDQRSRIYPALEASDGSTLSLDFTAMSNLDSRFTFTRSSTATFINSSGLVQFADHNLAVNSTWTDSNTPPTSWNIFNSTTPNAVISIPQSGQRQIVVTSGVQSFLWQSQTIPAGLAHTLSVVVHSVTGTGPTAANLLGINGSVAPPGSASILYYKDGVLSNGSTTVTPGVWSMVFSGGTQIRLLQSSNAATSTYTIVISSPQLQVGAVPLPAYVSNSSTSVAYHAPRFDYDPTTLAPRGLLIEGSSTNELLRSNAFNTSPWTITNFNTPSIASPAVTDPAGGTDTWYGVPSGAGTVYHGFRYTFTFTAAAYTFSIWAKAAQHDKFIISDLTNGNGACRFDLTEKTATVIAGTVTPTNPQIVPYPNGWFRCSFTMQMSAITTGMSWSSYPTGATTTQYGAQFTATGTDGMYFYGAQIELGSGASSYIPTGSSTVQRTADSCSIAMSSFAFSSSGGTFFVRADRGNFGVGNERSAIATPYASGLWLGVFTLTAGNVVYLMDWTTSSLTRGTGSTQNKIAYSYGQTTGSGATLQLPVSLAVNGSDAATGTFGNGTSNGANVANPANLLSSPLTLGAVAVSPPYTTSTGAWLNNCIQQLKYWPTRLSDAQLKSLTQ